MANTINKEVYTQICSRNEFTKILSENPGLIIIKFGASWCAPCNQIKNMVYDFFNTTPSYIHCYDLSIDDNTDVYSYLKSKKMITSIPTLLMYKKGNNFFAPDASVVGSNIHKLNSFFTVCRQFYT